jgi:ubiquinone biosynthesis protein
VAVLINLLKIFFLFVLFLFSYPFLKNRSIYYFLNFCGPSFIKLGQNLASRPDIIGKKLSEILSSFYDQVKPFSKKQVIKILNKEFGNKIDQIFSDFDFLPIASASIAQVHKAKINQQEVAVKILRPNIRKIVAKEIATIFLFTKLLKIFSPRFSKTFQDIGETLKQTYSSELDLLQEAANGSKLREDMKNVKGFYVPEIFWKFSTKEILVSCWINGIPFSQKESIIASNFDKKKIAENLVIAYFNQVYANGFFHADMHPGNLFLMENGDIAVVDFGIMGRLDKNTRIAVAEILIGFLKKDYQKVAQIHLDANLVPKNTDLIDLALACRKIGEMIVGNDVKDIQITKILAGLIEMTNKYQVSTKPELLLLQKTLLLVEGVGTILDPNLNMWNIAKPWVKQWAKTNIGFDAKIKDSFLDLFKILKNFLDKF